MTINKIFAGILLLGLLSLLGGCSSVGHGGGFGGGSDYAPNFHIDASKVPDAVPQPEPISKYGNPKSYVACGHRYYVMKSSAGYCQRGIASWYGMKFHKVRTSSGEMYDVAKMTAAHCTLPLPTYCLVTNLRNGKHVIVKVNDRGPFVANRLIDLSYVAAVKLGVTAHGTALVEVRAIDPCHPCRVLRSVPANAPMPVTKRARLYLQMGAFGVRSNAEGLADKVKGYVDEPVVITEGTLNGKTVYRVQIGPVPSVETSDHIYDRLKKAGLGKPIAVVQ